MGKKQRLKMIQTAIERLVEDEREDSGASDSHIMTDEDDRLLLSQLLSQIRAANSERYSRFRKIMEYRAAVYLFIGGRRSNKLINFRPTNTFPFVPCTDPFRLQIDSLKAGTEHHLPATVIQKTTSESTEASEVCSTDDSLCIEKPAMVEEILKELRNVKRQNHITHWLLSVVIVATAVWQLSEFSLLLLLKQKINHPFRAVGSLLFGRFKRALVDADKSEMIPAVEAPGIQLPKIPELPPVDISSLVPSNEES